MTTTWQDKYRGCATDAATNLVEDVLRQATVVGLRLHRGWLKRRRVRVSRRLQIWLVLVIRQKYVRLMELVERLEGICIDNLSS